jgi:RimJ/RimL family protein N-acetyltransferase
MIDQIRLRDVTQEDLPILFAQQLDPAANFMAAFTAADPTDWDAFLAHWRRILGDATITVQTILIEDSGVGPGARVAGSVSCFLMFGQPSVSYWLGKEYWGRGIATAALGAFLQQLAVRPLYARAAKDNAASLRVLEKCGFIIIGEDRGFANARGVEIEEFILELA